MPYLRSHHVSIWKGCQTTLKQIHTEIDRLVTALLREYSVNVGVKRKHSLNFAIAKEKYWLIYLPDSIKETLKASNYSSPPSQCQANPLLSILL